DRPGDRRGAAGGAERPAVHAAARAARQRRARAPRRLESDRQSVRAGRRDRRARPDPARRGAVPCALRRSPGQRVRRARARLPADGAGGAPHLRHGRARRRARSARGSGALGRRDSRRLRRPHRRGRARRPAARARYLLRHRPRGARALRRGGADRSGFRRLARGVARARGAARMSATPLALLIATVARLLEGCASVAVGNASPIPGAGALLARELSHGRLRVTTLGSRTYEDCTAGGVELFDRAAQGRLDAFFLGGGQIDGEGNINLVGVGEYPRMQVRWPGSFGSAYLYFLVPKVILFRLEHTPRVMVPKVDFISAPGTS